MKHLAILGASGHGKVLADTALQLGWIEVSFFDDNWPVLKLNSHWDVVGDTNKLLLELENFDGVIVAIGNNTVRLNKSKQLISESAKLITLIHPSATVSPFSSIGDGSFIGAGAILQVDCNIGLACIINTNAVIEHDCIISDGVHISPAVALAGGISIGAKSWIGIGSCVKELISIGNNSTVGAGSVVIRNVSNQTIAVGNPAKPLTKN